MATVMASNLYPPVINSYLPAFVDTDSARIDFSISDQNTLVDFRDKLECRITDSYTGQWTTLYKNFSNYDNRKCYFHVYNDDLQHGMRFENYKRYKLQIRLISNTYDGTINETELNKNLQYLTEWSTICIISFISQPYIELDNTSINYEEDIINLNATLKHSDSSSQDYLTGYKLYLRDETSGIIQVNDTEQVRNFSQNSYTNRITYNFRNAFITGHTYKLIIYYITNYMYEDQYSTTFTIKDNPIKTVSTFDLAVNNENGQILISVNFSVDETAVAIRRGSAEENFEYWDDLIILYRTDGQKEYSYNYKDTVSSSVMVYPSNTKDKTIVAFADNTVKSGVLYKYYLQAISGNIRIGKTQAQENFVVFDNAFLSTRGKTLVIKYDAEFTGFKRTKLDTKTETLGSKYPFIRRNGAVDYKQITLSGLISYLADEEQLFCSQDYLHNLSFYDETTYNKYKKRYNINPYNDTITERNFREKVLDFLYSDNVKLFRTSQEGNILVKLMDITLTPKQELGRHIYSFSCTAYEVADDGVPNYQKYQVY